MIRILAVFIGLWLTATAVPAQAKTVRDHLQSQPELSIFAEAIETAGLSQHLGNDRTITLFVPSDRALRNEGSAFLLERVLTSQANEGRLSAALSHHIIPDVRLDPNVIGNSNELDTLAGVCLRINKYGSALKVGPEAVATKRIEADNGVLYIVDRMLWAGWRNANVCADPRVQIGTAS